jgi:hypothetical protein
MLAVQAQQDSAREKGNDMEIVHELEFVDSEVRRLRQWQRARRLPNAEKLEACLLESNDQFLKGGPKDTSKVEAYKVLEHSLTQVSSFDKLQIQNRQSGLGYDGRDSCVTIYGSCAETSTLSENLFSFEVDLTTCTDTPDVVSSMVCRASPWVRAEIGCYLDTYCKERKVTHLLHLLSEYGRVSRIRYNVFQQLSRRYLVSNGSWRNGDTIQFAPRLGFRLVLRWPVTVVRDSVRSQPSISLDYSKTGE